MAEPVRPPRRLLAGWLLASRIPFLSVGVAPFLLGAALAARDGALVRGPVLGLGTAAVVLVMLATYWNGETYDQEEDLLSGRMERNAFSGGSQAVQRGLISPRATRSGALAAAAAAAAIGGALWLLYRTGPLTVPLGAVGLFAGFWYSARPVRLVSSGFGELFIGVCYGWLPVATGYYLQAGTLPAWLIPVSLPVAFTIVNVILVNEFPDYPADHAAGKRNLLVRVGKQKGAAVYFLLAAGAAGAALLLPLTAGYPAAFLAWYAPVGLLTLGVGGWMRAGAWRGRKALERACALTIVANLATTAVLALPFFLGGPA